METKNPLLGVKDKRYRSLEPLYHIMKYHINVMHCLQFVHNLLFIPSFDVPGKMACHISQLTVVLIIADHIYVFLKACNRCIITYTVVPFVTK
ncbi:hypothetical protein CU097_006339 [Rhizopus azygosporus]|uniref:Uncharacterized protein n=1 Tax=Rhizopus azygosporus TaxID=86630 RepID=A0A367J316_RHIAZ|nr:hypothetical protein CU097_006339 [Rhizopus azygosporus]